MTLFSCIKQRISFSYSLKNEVLPPWLTSATTGIIAPLTHLRVLKHYGKPEKLPFTWKLPSDTWYPTGNTVDNFACTYSPVCRETPQSIRFLTKHKWSNCAATLKEMRLFDLVFSFRTYQSHSSNRSQQHEVHCGYQCWAVPVTSYFLNSFHLSRASRDTKNTSHSIHKTYVLIASANIQQPAHKSQEYSIWRIPTCQYLPVAALLRLRGHAARKLYILMLSTWKLYHL